MVITLKSSLGYDSSDYINLDYKDDLITDRFLSCDNMPIQLKTLEIENVKGGYLEVYKVIRKYIVKGVFAQLYLLFNVFDIDKHCYRPWMSWAICSTSRVKKRRHFSI